MPKVMFGSWQPDVASIDQQNTSYLANVLPNANGYGPFKDMVAISDALPARCLGLFGVIDEDNTAHLFAGTATKLYKANSTTRAWDDVTRASGGDYSVGDREYWNFAIFGQNVVAVTDSNNPQVYTIGTSTDFADLGGSPPQARFVSVVGDFLVLSGLSANPARIHWSALNDITGWTVGTNSSDYQEFPDGGFTLGVSGGEFGIVYQESAIRRMVFNPVSTSIFDFSRIVENRGLFMSYSLAKIHGVNFFYSSDGFYKIDSAGVLTPIGENKVDRYFSENADLSNPRNMIGISDPQAGRVWWLYRSIDNTNDGYLDKVIVYDWLRNQWSPASINLEFIGGSTNLGATLEGLDAIGDLDSLTISLDTYQTTPVFKLTGVGTDHKPGYFTGDALEATFDLPEAAIGNATRMAVMNVAPVSDAASAYVSVGGREHLNATATYSTETAISARGYAAQRKSGRFLTVRLRIPAATTWTWARGVDVDIREMGLR